jgi:hypothetical protein
LKLSRYLKSRSHFESPCTNATRSDPSYTLKPYLGINGLLASKIQQPMGKLLSTVSATAKIPTTFLVALG